MVRRIATFREFVPFGGGDSRLRIFDDEHGTQRSIAYHKICDGQVKGGARHSLPVLESRI